MNKRRPELNNNRSEEYEQRFNLFMSKIRSYQTEELNKIGEKSKD
jgi:hypothetical protein